MRKLLSEAVVSFEIEVAVTSDDGASFTSADDLLEAVSETLTEIADDASDFLSAVSESSGSDTFADVEVTGVEAAVVTPSPTSEPTPEPYGDDDDDGFTEGVDAASTSLIGVGAAFGGAFLVIGGFLAHRKYSQRGSAGRHGRPNPNRVGMHGAHGQPVEAGTWADAGIGQPASVEMVSRRVGHARQ